MKGNEMKVEELSQYGKTLSDLPKEAIKKQKSIVFQEMKTKFGLFGLLPFMIKMLIEQKKIKNKYPAVYEDCKNRLSEFAAKEFLMLTAMFQVITRKEGKQKSYDFLKGIFQKMAVYSMPAYYQLDDLIKCEGDTFDNFVKFNVAWFGAMNDEGTFKVSEMKPEKDKLTIIVNECANCVYGSAYDCPDIAKLGCDHDLAGYPLITNKVNAEFRRPHTIAKGDDFCDFMFYRKETAPEYEAIDGKKVKWDDSLNK
jgi:hypothetical protein